MWAEIEAELHKDKGECDDDRSGTAVAAGTGETYDDNPEHHVDSTGQYDWDYYDENGHAVEEAADCRLSTEGYQERLCKLKKLNIRL